MTAVRRTLGQVHPWLLRSPVAPVLRLRWLEPLREVVSVMSPDDVLESLEALDQAGVRAWVAGGWGVDALLGTQTRRHADLDLVLDDVEAVPAALRALATLGLDVVSSDVIGGRWMRDRWKASDQRGRHVDLLRVDARSLPAAAPFATGSIGGRSVPCLAPDAQVTLHTGYPLRRPLRRDLALLCERWSLPFPLQPPGRRQRLARRAGRISARLRRRLLRTPAPRSTALVVSAPLPEPVEALRCRYVSPGELATPPHVTVLHPFVPAEAIGDQVARSVETALTGFGSFRFRLTHVEQFPSGVVYLAPEPADRFTELTESVNAYWPEYPPYDGAYDDIVPHVTIAAARLPDHVVEELTAALPIEMTASEVQLIAEHADGSWSTMRRFRLRA